ARARRTAARLEAAQAELTPARAQLAAARARLQAARIEDREMQRRLDEAVARLQQARADVAQGRAALGEQRDEVASMISSIYQEGDPELLALGAIMSSQTPADLTHQMEARSVMVGEQTRAYDELRAAEVLLVVREGQVADAKAEAAARRREAAEHLTVMQAAEQDAADAEAAVRTSVSRNRRATQAAERARAADLRQLRALQAEEERIQEMLRQRAQAARNGHSGSPQPSGGYLSYPVNGPVTSPFGYRVHPIYGYYSLHDGTDFGAGCGQPLFSAADGTVLSSYWSTAYGNRMIIDNGYARGVGLATIYNHAIRYTVGVGDHVRRGEVIGYVGTTGWSTGCHLHFTVMVNGTPVDPMGWL
ncbi:MAG TPA: M23 family metallopeptidase, partial [Nocardioides sp.]|uniref:M23 family metallopeptidase n=1 Tax=Nocardioides sp. TaxID=35761 RepID=UPI002CCF6DBF